MGFDKYSVSQYSVSSLLGFIEAGDIAIPEIQRPFVWKGRQVRDLIDSLYSGYPTGYLIVWQNPDVRLKNGESSVGKKILIDGQQRVTALMTAIAGLPVLNENYEQKQIKIAFNPLAKDAEDRFAVRTPAHDKSSAWISDISQIFRANFDSYDFIDRYAEKNPSVSKRELNQAILRLLEIKNCQLGVITLMPKLDISEVTEIFVRINSQGKHLNEADFAMSKIAADQRYGGNILRKAIDYFCHLARDPGFYGQLSAKECEFMASEYADKLKWLKNDYDDIYDPDYGDMLRVSFMHQFGRGKLGDLVSLLSGRDFETKTYKDEIIEESFAKFKTGILNFMNQYNFNQFVLAIRAAGFTSSKLLTSKMTLDFAYTLFLLLKRDPSISAIELKSYVQKWFVLSTITGRYIGSPETQMDRDLRSIAEKGFLKFFQEVEAGQLSESFWSVTLVQALETSAVNSPYFNTFIAAQIYNAETSLLSSSAKVSDLLATRGDIHHIFPKEYLKRNGIAEKSQYNQVANYTYLDTSVNISIGKKAPCDYFKEALIQCSTKVISTGTILDREVLYDNLKENCIPAEIVESTFENYPSFLQERRKLMAEKIKNYYHAL